MQRNVVALFGDHDMGQEALAGQAFLHHLGRLGGAAALLVATFSAAADEGDVFNHLERRGFVVDSLVNFFTNSRYHLVATRADALLLRQGVLHPASRQIFARAFAFAFGATAWFDRGLVHLGLGRSGSFETQGLEIDQGELNNASLAK